MKPPPPSDEPLNRPSNGAGLIANQDSADLDSADLDSADLDSADLDSADLDAPTVAPAPHFPCEANRTAPGPGAVIDDYEIVREIARGGMGVVYLANQRSLSRAVALKMVLDGEAAEQDHLERFAIEAEAAAALDHPGIVPVYDVGQHNGFPYFSMAYVDGQSLAAKLVDGPLEPVRAAIIAREVAEAISHAHQQQIIHRDIKPANILIDQQGAPRITDFGVCKTLSSASNLTSSGELIGTPHYMPPEQAGAQSDSVGAGSDVYSIGAVLYAMLTGRPPFQAANPLDVVSQVLLQPPVSPQQLNPSVPLELDVIALKCLSKSPRDRYLSAQALAADLNRFCNNEPIHAKPPGLWQRSRFFVRKHVLFASVSGSVALLLVLLTAIVSFALFQARSELAKLEELLESERIVAVQFARIASSGQATQQSYDITRLAKHAKRYRESLPDLALQLAIQAATIATEHDLELPAETRTLLESALPTEQTSTMELGQLVELARGQVQKPLNDYQRALHGITLADESDQPEEKP